MTSKFKILINATCWIITLIISGCFHKQHQLTFVKQQSIAINPSVTDSITQNHFLNKYKKSLEAEMGQIIGFNDSILVKDKPNGTLGNMVCDAMLNEAKKNNTVAAAVMNYGGVRVPRLGIGNVNIGQVFEIMPFDNLLYVVKVPGPILDTLCQHIAKSGGWPIAGISFVIKNKTASDIQVNDIPLNHNTTYNIAMSDYIVNGGDNCTFLSHLQKVNTNIMVRDAIINYIKDKKVLGKSLMQNPIKRIKN
jgi:2',3'-cyclic-nucleotide 2'-phosphodiesterase (5'-nucleotidase family)